MTATGNTLGEHHDAPTMIGAEDGTRLDLPIVGMTCSACAARLQKALARADGIQAADVNFATENARVQFDGATTDVPSIVGVVKRTGFEVAEDKFSFGVGGMTCSLFFTLLMLPSLLRLGSARSVPVPEPENSPRVAPAPVA